MRLLPFRGPMRPWCGWRPTGFVTTIFCHERPAAQRCQARAHTGDLDFSEVGLALTEDQGAQVVIDTVGSAVYPSTWRSLAPYGRWVLLGVVAGSPVRIGPAEVIFRDARILGSSGVSREGVFKIAGMVSKGLVKPIVGRILAMEEASTAYGLTADRRVMGRILLIPPGSPTPMPGWNPGGLCEPTARPHLSIIGVTNPARGELRPEAASRFYPVRQDNVGKSRWNRSSGRTEDSNGYLQNQVAGLTLDFLYN